MLALLGSFLYSSYFEWFAHRYWMHEKRFPLYIAFHGHTVVHHQLYHWNGKFETDKPGIPPNVLMRWYAFPGMIAIHMPAFYLFQRLSGLHGWWLFWGMTAGCSLYFLGFEYMHFLMHASRGHWVERTRAFKFLKEHHRLHHKYYLRNINVFIPLADLTLGTLVTSEGWRSKPQKRRRNLLKNQTEPKKVPAKTEV